MQVSLTILRGGQEFKCARRLSLIGKCEALLMDTTSQQWQPADEVMASLALFNSCDLETPMAQAQRSGCHDKAVEQQLHPMLMARHHTQEGFRNELERHGIRTDSRKR
jgi:hypothetical protein